MRKENRKRNKALSIRMNEAEYEEFMKRIKESGLTQQAYTIGAVCSAKVTSADEIDKLKEISSSFSDLNRQLRGLSTNVNQMARIANSEGYTASVNELKRLYEEIQFYRRESEENWQLIRSSIGGQTRMEP